MKVTLDRVAFTDALSTLSLLTPTRPTTPILGVVKMSTTKKKKEPCLELFATDFEISAKVICGVKDIQEEGTLILPTSKILPILKEIKSEEVNLDSDGAVAHITVDQESYKIVGLNEGEYPEQTGFEGELSGLEVPKEFLIDAIKRVRISVSAEPIRYCLSGVRINAANNKLSMISTDGRRISIVETNMNDNSSKTSGTTIPPKALDLLLRLIHTTEAVKIGISDNFSRIHSDNFEINSRSIEGNYPDVKTAISNKFRTKFEINKDDLLSSLRKLALVSDKETRPVTLTLKNNKLILEGAEKGASEGRITLNCNYKGDTFKIRFKNDYIADYLGVVKSDSVAIEMNSASEISRFHEPGQSEVVYYLMPIVIKEE